MYRQHIQILLTLIWISTGCKTWQHKPKNNSAAKDSNTLAIKFASYKLNQLVSEASVNFVISSTKKKWHGYARAPQLELAEALDWVGNNARSCFLDPSGRMIDAQTGNPLPAGCYPYMLSLSAGMWLLFPTGSKLSAVIKNSRVEPAAASVGHICLNSDGELSSVDDNSPYAPQNSNQSAIVAIKYTTSDAAIPSAVIHNKTTKLELADSNTLLNILAIAIPVLTAGVMAHESFDNTTNSLQKDMKYPLTKDMTPEETMTSGKEHNQDTKNTAPKTNKAPPLVQPKRHITFENKKIPILDSKTAINSLEELRKVAGNYRVVALVVSKNSELVSEIERQDNEHTPPYAIDLLKEGLKDHNSYVVRVRRFDLEFSQLALAGHFRFLRNKGRLRESVTEVISMIDEGKRVKRKIIEKLDDIDLATATRYASSKDFSRKRIIYKNFEKELIDRKLKEGLFSIGDADTFDTLGLENAFKYYATTRKGVQFKAVTIASESDTNPFLVYTPEQGPLALAAFDNEHWGAIL